MSHAHHRSGRLRSKTGEHHHRVTFVELFFDLVFVFAVTQISHTLAEHYTLLTSLQMLFVLLAVWWVWIYTSWVTNWLDPDHVAVRLMLFVLMLAGLVLSTSIPEAFEGGGVAFGSAYAFMQVSRSVFTLYSFPKSDPGGRNNFIRITVWLAFAAVFWIAGGFAEGEWRLALWLIALAVEICGPSARFWTPGLGASRIADWNIDGGHMAERCGSFVIIAFGESVLVTGATFAKQGWSQTSVTAFLVAFVGSLAMWWIYFDKGAELGSKQISHASDPGRLARLAYTYLHLPIVAGIVICAVSDDFILAHAQAPANAPQASSIVGGPLVFLVGCMLFKRAIRGWYQPSHLAGIAALALLFAVNSYVAPLSQIGLAAAATAILIVVCVWEWLSLGAASSPAGAD